MTCHTLGLPLLITNNTIPTKGKPKEVHFQPGTSALITSLMRIQKEARTWEERARLQRQREEDIQQYETSRIPNQGILYHNNAAVDLWKLKFY
jgi:hypothetical protein